MYFVEEQNTIVFLYDHIGNVSDSVRIKGNCHKTVKSSEISERQLVKTTFKIYIKAE